MPAARMATPVGGSELGRPVELNWTKQVMHNAMWPAHFHTYFMLGTVACADITVQTS